MSSQIESLKLKQTNNNNKNMFNALHVMHLEYIKLMTISLF